MAAALGRYHAGTHRILRRTLFPEKGASDGLHRTGNDPAAPAFRMKTDVGTKITAPRIEVSVFVLQLHAGIFDDAEVWGVETLKGWVEDYESSRFTAIDTHTAVITSEYNMECLLEWLKRHTPIAEITEC